MPTPDWYREKASFYRAAWVELFGTAPSVQNISLGMSPAVLETRCGDAWPGPDGAVNTADDERNWGAANLRALNSREQQAISVMARSQMTAAGVNRGDDWYLDFNNHAFSWVDTRGRHDPLSAPETIACGLLLPSVSKGHEQRALAAMAALDAAGVPFPQGRIHCDSAPGRGAFFVWFATFPDHVQGAKYYLQILCGKTGHRQAKRVLEGNGTPWELAAAMKAAGYFGGFHVDSQDYPDPQNPGHTVKGLELNIRDYAELIARHQPSIRNALESQDDEPTNPDHPTNPLPLPQRNLRRGMKGQDVGEWQAQLQHDGWVVEIDDDFGFETDSATRKWQAARKLKPDGVVGPLTRAKIGTPGSGQSSSQFRAVKPE